MRVTIAGDLCSLQSYVTAAGNIYKEQLTHFTVLCISTYMHG